MALGTERLARSGYACLGIARWVYKDHFQLTGMEVEMLLRNVLLLSLVILTAPIFLCCQAGKVQDPMTISPYPQGPVKPKAANCSPASLILEYDRAIFVLERGVKENWSIRDQYLAAFDNRRNTGTAGEAMMNAKEYVRAAIIANLPIHQIWDESFPLGVDVHRTIAEFTKRRNQLLADENIAP
jgi:hypothetical protein